MKTRKAINQHQSHSSTNARLTFLEVSSLLAVVAGSWYLWVNNVIPLYVKTSIFTVIGGINAFTVGQIIQKGYIEPIQELQKTIGEVGSALLVYSNTGDSIVNEELRKEATQTLRKLSGDLLGKRRVVANYKMFVNLGILPPKQDIIDAVRSLILMSNCVGQDKEEAFHEASNHIKRMLWLDV